MSRLINQLSPNPRLQRTPSAPAFGAAEPQDVGRLAASREVMRAQHWVIWVIGWFATLAMVAVIPLLKSSAHWYEPIFVIAAGYCLVARAAAAYVRRTARQMPSRQAWLRAFSTARVGFLVVIAVAVVIVGAGILALATK